ncbi:MAG: GIY-YIG nuclease family protein [Bacteroidetes bacterium]|nr:GIY-YIG nuclease family protein [Bacteroidota bacterium]
MFYTYILYSKKLNSFYKGETGNINDRLSRHNSYSIGIISIMR